MKQIIFLLGSFFCGIIMYSQPLDTDILMVKARLDSIIGYSANMSLDVNAEFIKMPTKFARVIYTKNEPLSFSSDDFVLIPKKGLDFTLSQLFEHPFITVDRGRENLNGKTYKAVNIIPENNKSDYTIAKLLLDTALSRIVRSEIHTKKEGSFTVELKYTDEESILPHHVEIFFELEQLRLPFNFLGKNAQIDRTKMRSQDIKTGSIILKFEDYDIVRNTEESG